MNILKPFYCLCCLLFLNGSLKAQYLTKNAFPNLRFKNCLEIIPAPDGSNRLFVVSQNGFIEIVENDPNTTQKKRFLDIQNLVIAQGEMGLLGLAFHPDFQQNGYFYVYYSRTNQSGSDPYESILARYQVLENDPDQADPASQLILLSIKQPFNNHNGGKIAFGNDGYLYLASGDGGGAGDPLNFGQNTTNLLGNILRIDVDNADEGLNYGIPSDNPFVGNTDNIREEIYAFGFRNPWKFSVDRPTGQIWVADVGQNRFEEIDILEKGKNYGWPLMEGNQCFKPSNCDTTGLTFPVWSYSQSRNDRSVTGGYVYRGDRLPGLQGQYIHGDFISGRVWALNLESGQPDTTQLFDLTNGQLASFGEDHQNELYISMLANEGVILKILPEFELSQDSLIFGEVPADSTASLSLEIANNRQEALEITSIGLPKGFMSDWNGGTIAAESNQQVQITFAPGGSGTFAGDVIIQSNLLEQVIPVEGVSLAITSLAEELSLKVLPYPNPSQGDIQIQWEPSKQIPTSIRILNTQGEVLRVYSEIKRNQTSGLWQIPMQDLPAGNYLLEIRTDQASGTIRVQKN